MPRVSGKRKAQCEAARQKALKRWKRDGDEVSETRGSSTTTTDATSPATTPSTSSATTPSSHFITEPHMSATSYRHNLLPQEEREVHQTNDGEWMREAEKTEQAQQKLRTRKVKHVAMPEPNPLSKFALKEEKEQDAEMVKAWFLTMEEESPCLDGSMFAEIKQEDTDEISIDIKEEPIDFKTEGLHNGLKLPVETMEEARLCNMKEESPSLDSSAATGRELLYNVGEMTSSEEWNWDSNKTMSLIQQYERFPELWNVSLVHYRNKEKKTSAIKEIAKTLKIPESEITRKWHNLRYQMNSEMRKIKKKKNGVGTDEVTVKSTWKFFDALHFMIGCNTPQGITSANMDLSSSTNIVNEDVTQPSEQFQDDVILSTSGTQHDKDKISGKNKKAAEMEVETALKTAIDVLDKPQDDYSVFGDYVASELRQLRSDENRKKLKRTITKAIIEMGEMEDLQYSSSSSTPIPPLSLNEPHSSDGASIHHGTTSQL